MIVSLKHRLMLWVPCLAYVLLVIGDFHRGAGGDFVLRTTFRGVVSATLVLFAAACLTSGGRGWFIAGVVLWLLGLAALLLSNATLVVVHF